MKELRQANCVVRAMKPAVDWIRMCTWRRRTHGAHGALWIAHAREDEEESACWNLGKTGGTNWLYV